MQHTLLAQHLTALRRQRDHALRLLDALRAQHPPDLAELEIVSTLEALAESCPERWADPAHLRAELAAAWRRSGSPDWPPALYGALTTIALVGAFALGALSMEVVR